MTKPYLQNTSIMKSNLPPACSFAEKVKIVTIPRDLEQKLTKKQNGGLNGKFNRIELKGKILPPEKKQDDQDVPGTGTGEKIVNLMDHNHSSFLCKIFSLETNRKKNTVLEINTTGGDLIEAKRIIAKMKEQNTIVIIDGNARSAGLVIAFSGDNVYATSKSILFTHGTQAIASTTNENLLKHLKNITKKTPPYTAQDFFEVANHIKIDDSNAYQDSIVIAQNMVNDEKYYNEYVIKCYEDAHKSITHEVARSLVTSGNIYFTPIDALKLGFIDAVLQDDEKTMLVRANDPRAQEISAKTPNLYQSLNP